MTVIIGKTQKQIINLSVNGKIMSGSAPPRMLLSDFIRHHLGLTGTHVGCEHGVCGACTILIDGVTARSCLTFAVQMEGCDIQTVEGLALQSDEGIRLLSDIQEAFRRHFALQCGFCTSGILMSTTQFLSENTNPSEDEVRDMLSGHLCRCTGYQPIVEAVLEVAKIRNSSPLVK